MAFPILSDSKFLAIAGQKTLHTSTWFQKHFFFELTGIIIVKLRSTSKLHTPRVVKCGSILIIKYQHSEEWK